MGERRDSGVRYGALARRPDRPPLNRDAEGIKIRPIALGEVLAKFAKAVLRLTDAELREKWCLSMDGIVLTMPPKDRTARYNYCRYGEDHMYRKPSESLNPDLAGDDPYGEQSELARCIPMWGLFLQTPVPPAKKLGAPPSPAL